MGGEVHASAMRQLLLPRAIQRQDLSRCRPTLPPMLRLLERDRGIFTRGEEIVLRLDGVEVLDFARAEMVPSAALPAWSIGVIAAVVREEGDRHGSGGRRYAVFFRHGRRECVCIVTDAAIEGTA